MPKQSKVASKLANPRFEFRWQNFRSFRETPWIEVRPITVMIGANNSGKTSLLLPLLLLKQTLESRDPSVALKTSGQLARLGTFKDVVYGHRSQAPISFHFRFAYPRRDGASQKGKVPTLGPPGSASFEFCCGRTSGDIKLTRFEVRDINGKICLVRSLLKNGHYSLRFAEKFRPGVVKFIRRSAPQHFLFSPSQLFREIVRQQIADQAKRQPKQRRGPRRERYTFTFSGEINEYMDTLTAVESEVSTLLSQISYVGPLREYPKRFYESGDEIPQTVGARGENAPEILFLKKEQVFQRHVQRWLRAFELAHRVDCEPLHAGIFAVRIKAFGKGSQVDLADTGFGLSQLLPLIVEGFHAAPKSVVFVEQPEIHLNPKMQCTLANFFAAIAAEKKAVIVETHSEHLVLRLRSLIAEGSLKPEDVALYFVEKIKSKSCVRRIAIHDDGHIEPDEWPKGFFQDSVSEALRLARV